MVVCICDGLHFSTTTVSTYHKHLSDNRVKIYGRPNLRRHSISTFELHDILFGSIRHPSQNFRLSKFSRVVLVDFWVSPQVSGVIRRSRGKVMAICICDGIHFSTMMVSTYHNHLSDNRVKSYGCPNLRRYSVSTFELCHTLISSRDHCLMACNLCLTASRYLAPIVA